MVRKQKQKVWITYSFISYTRYDLKLAFVIILLFKTDKSAIDYIIITVFTQEKEEEEEEERPR